MHPSPVALDVLVSLLLGVTAAVAEITVGET